MISARNVHVAFGDREVLKGVSLDVPTEGILGVVGPNGCGKTTLLRTLYGSQAVTSGTVSLDGKDISAMKRRDLAREMAVVVQEHVSELPITVADLVMLGRLPYQRFSSQPTPADEELVERMLRLVGLLDKAGSDYSRLSGGERQRALIARAFAQESRFLLLDEPTNHLDIRYQHEVLALLTHTDSGGLVVLHDLNLTAKYCDAVAVMEDGKIVAHGAPDDVLVPDILEPIYNVAVDRADDAGGMHLHFSLPDQAITR